MAFSAVSSFLFVLLLPLVSSHLLIPSHFTSQNISDYTVRYLSMDGEDEEACQTSQPFPYDVDQGKPCRTLRYAITGGHDFMTDNVTNVIVLVLPGKYSYGNVTLWLNYAENVAVKRVPGVGWEGEAILNCTERLLATYNNFYFVDSNYLLFEGLVFTECGPHSDALSFNEISSVVINNCTFRDNWNSGLVTFNPSNTLINNTVFRDNTNIRPYRQSEFLDPGEFSFSGGYLITFQQPDPNPDPSNTTLAVAIRNCKFLRNTASLSMNSNDNRPRIYVPRGHGGAMVMSFNSTINQRVVIENSEFANNSAVHNGGGVYVTMFKGSKGNRVIIRNSTFTNNSCFLDGGAISMHFFEITNDNLLWVEDSAFEKNAAWVGGGACAINLQDNLIEEGTILIENVAGFSNCTFSNNSSPTGGSSVGLVSNARVDQALATTNFSDCTFTANGQLNQSAAVFAFRFPISLQGTVVFTANKGGGIALLQTRADAMGTILFEKNEALEGAGIAMQEQSLLHLFSGSHVTFLKNKAITVGGAISVRNPSVSLDVILLFNTRCFIQYQVNTSPPELDPQDWNVTLNFFNNTAGDGGAAIYATDISRCTYTLSQLRPNENEFKNSIFALSQFNYRDNNVLNSTGQVNEELTTAPSKLIVSPMWLSSALGEVLSFSVSAVDQSDNWKRAIWSLDDTVQQQNTSAETQEFFALPPRGREFDYTMPGVEPERYSADCGAGVAETLNFSLVQVIAGGVSDTTTVYVNLTCCHPGYRYDKGSQTCLPDGGYIVRPDARNRYVYLQPEIYAEVRDGNLLTSVMPPAFQKCTREGTLTGCLFKFDSPEEQCEGNRTGFLCGHCPVGEGVDLTLNQCKQCTVGDAVILAVIVFLLVVVSWLVLIFNIGVPNDMKACLFFVQVVGFIYHNSHSERIGTSWDFHLSRLFGFSFYLPICPAPGYNALITASYGFILPIIGFGTIVAYIISARFVRPLSHRPSFEGIWLLSLFTYKYTADTCFNILRCQKVSGADNYFVYYYDGTIQCFDTSDHHLGLSVFALLLGLVVVVLFPVLITVISFKRFKHTQPFTDVLNKGLKTSCRWWSGFDLFRRLLFILVVFAFNYFNPNYNQLALLAAGLLVFLVFTCAQPYQKMSTNVIEALVLLDLLLLTGLFLNLDERNRTSTHVLAKIFLLLPFIGVMIYITGKVAALIWVRLSPVSFRTFLTKKVPNLPKRQKSRGLLIGHDLENRRNSDYDVAGASDLSADYSEYREELLADLEDEGN